MARIRKIEIRHFRGIGALDWCPCAGINCLIGPGDSGKSSVLDAIDLCLGSRRNVQLTDTDFHLLDVETSIIIDVTVGELDDALKNFESYGMYLRGFDASSGAIHEEPEKDAETVLTVRLSVASDLEPNWSLVSERANAQGLSRNLNWADRIRIAPTQIGVNADYHLGWRRGSVLNRVSEERADAGAALAKAARHARNAFGEHAQEQLGQTLGIVAATADELGIPIGANVKAMLDAHSVSFNGGTISLHDEGGVPLHGLGTGSARLLVAGLQRKAAARSTIMLMDELEHGLEPHRIIRLLGSLGSKERKPPLQLFMTTHSPVAVRELSGGQLYVMRSGVDVHNIVNVGLGSDTQSTVRLYPDAFLAATIIVCEGASEVGLLRGLDLYRTANDHSSIVAYGAAFVDCGGGEADRPFERAAAFRSLGYRAAIVRDDDKKPSTGIEEIFVRGGGKVFSWRDGKTLEDELFSSLTDEGVSKLLQRAIDLHGESLIDDHIKSASVNSKNLKMIQSEELIDGFSVDSRLALGGASRMKKAGWFKSVTWMEDVARDIVGPDIMKAESGFKAIVDDIFSWAGVVGE